MPTNNNGEIFHCNNCGNRTQTEDRRKVLFHDYNDGHRNYYFELTDSQIDLLNYLIEEEFLDAKFEFMTDMDFVAP